MGKISIYCTPRLLYPPLKTKLIAGEGYWSGPLENDRLDSSAVVYIEHKNIRAEMEIEMIYGTLETNI